MKSVIGKEPRYARAFANLNESWIPFKRKANYSVHVLHDIVYRILSYLDTAIHAARAYRGEQESARSNIFTRGPIYRLYQKLRRVTDFFDINFYSFLDDISKYPSMVHPRY
jgi:hypothetical protein